MARAWNDCLYKPSDVKTVLVGSAEALFLFLWPLCVERVLHWGREFLCSIYCQNTRDIARMIQAHRIRLANTAKSAVFRDDHSFSTRSVLSSSLQSC